MPALEDQQRAIMATIDGGPALLPAGLFAGAQERVLAGLRVHANTISHARLVALEDTYPRTRALLGDAPFHRLARDFLEQPGVTARALSAIGAGFDTFCAGRSDGAQAADLALFEWRWLEAYHAAEAEPLALAALAGLDPDALLAVSLIAHPAARTAAAGPGVRAALAGEVPGLEAAELALITRPGAEVLVAAASPLIAALLAQALLPQPIGNLLAGSDEPMEDEAMPVDAAMQALVALIEAGALRRV